MSKMRSCSKCLAETNELYRIDKTDVCVCKKCADKLNNAGIRIFPVVVFASHIDEINDALKSAKWNVTGGYRLWCQYEGKNLTNKEKQIEEDRRLEHYAKLRIKKELLARGIFV